MEDPSVFFGTNNSEEQENFVAEAMHQKKSAEDFSQELENNQIKSEKTEFSELEELISQQFATDGNESTLPLKKVTSGYSGNNFITPSIFEFTKSTLECLKSKKYKINYRIFDDQGIIKLNIPEALRELGAFGLGFTKNVDSRWMPKEAIPADNILLLTNKQKIIKEEIKKSRMNDESSWSELHYLWEVNPLVDWLSDQTAYFFQP